MEQIRRFELELIFHEPCQLLILMFTGFSVQLMCRIRVSSAMFFGPTLTPISGLRIATLMFETVE